MIDPELAAYADAMPVFELTDPEAARQGFESLLEGLNHEVPE
jgi:hypothetical protein